MKRRLMQQYDLWGNLTHKECSRCWGILPLVKFSKRSQLSSGLSVWCKDCARSRQTETYVKQTRDWSLRRNYDLTQESWDALFESQGRRCAACGSPDAGSDRGWHTDHIHGTKTVRGILCTGCNLAIGFLKDDPGRADMIAAYLRRRESDGNLVAHQQGIRKT